MEGASCAAKAQELRGVNVGVNDPIHYRWTLGWDPEGITEPKPVVNPLIKALLEHDYQEMDVLYRKGARLNAANNDTLLRTLFHIAGDYRTIRWLVEHGLYGDSYMRHDKDGANGSECVGPDGYITGAIARAWILGSYESMALLASRGFDYMHICVGGEKWELDELICQKNDVRAMRLLREHGYRVQPWDHEDWNFKRLKRKFPTSTVIKDMEEHPLVKRKSVGLDGERLAVAPLEGPKLVKVRFFHREEDERWNALERADYDDRVRAQKEFAARWQKSKSERDEDDRIAALAIEAMRANASLYSKN